MKVDKERIKKYLYDILSNVAADTGIIPQELSTSLRPFFDFRNSFVHKYWIIDDAKLLKNCR